MGIATNDVLILFHKESYTNAATDAAVISARGGAGAGGRGSIGSGPPDDFVSALNLDDRWVETGCDASWRKPRKKITTYSFMWSFFN